MAIKEYQYFRYRWCCSQTSCCLCTYFEERYKQMVQDVSETDKVFGVNFIEPEPGRSESEHRGISWLHR